ncbi:MAG TPA: hypothetical protein VFO67_08525 [Gemmatimonadales bacterium]|nr:hypothetical protein [Gemmatimonadales bacterium]
MGKRRAPRRRKTDALDPEPLVPEPLEPEPVAPEPSSEVVVHRAPPPVPPIVAEVIDTLRAVAGRMIDIADAAADAVTRRLEGRA